MSTHVFQFYGENSSIKFSFFKKESPKFNRIYHRCLVSARMNEYDKTFQKEKTDENMTKHLTKHLKRRKQMNLAKHLKLRKQMNLAKHLEMRKLMGRVKDLNIERCSLLHLMAKNLSN